MTIPELQGSDFSGPRGLTDLKHEPSHAEAKRRCGEYIAELRFVLHAHMGSLPLELSNAILDDFYGSQYEKAYCYSYNSYGGEQGQDAYQETVTIEQLEAQLDLMLSEEKLDDPLTPDEQRMIGLLSEGCDLKYLPPIMGYSRRGAERRHTKMLKKLQARTDAHAVRKRFEAGQGWRKPLAINYANLVKYPPLEPEEEECLRLISLGKPKSEIADRMGYAISSITRISGSAVKKLGAENKAHAVRIALEAGLMTLEPENLADKT